MPNQPLADASNRLTGRLIWPDARGMMYPSGTLEGYEERQAELSRLARRWVELNPNLTTLNPAKPKLRGATLAAQNIRQLLKRAYPFQVPAPRVTTDKHSNGSSVLVEWIDWGSPESPRAADLRDHLSLFETGHYNGSMDEFEYDTNLVREAFRKAFGGTTMVAPQPRSGTPEERAAFEQRTLRAVMTDETPLTQGATGPHARRL